MDHICAYINADAPAAYFEGWWDVIATGAVFRLLRSKRTGTAAAYDVGVLLARLNSGLFVGGGWHRDHRPAGSSMPRSAVESWPTACPSRRDRPCTTTPTAA